MTSEPPLPRRLLLRVARLQYVGEAAVAQRVGGLEDIVVIVD